MKNLLKITLSLLFIAASFTSCVDDKDFDTPQIIEEDNNLGNTTLDKIKVNFVEDYQGTPSTLIKTFPMESASQGAIYVPAYVVSDDTTGNFYKKLIVQDNPVNPTMGMEILINTGNLHTIYNVGRKIYIKLNGLTLGYFDGQQGDAPNYDNQSNPNDDIPGVYKLGVLGELNSINRISELDFEKHITRTSVSETIIPTVITSSDISDSTMNTVILIDNMQFKSEELGKTFAAESGESYDATRFMKSCETYNELGLMTSTYASFKLETLPESNGSVVGILMKNYREREPVVVVTSPNDIDFTNDRCLFVSLLEEDFESYDEYEANIPDWLNVNTNGGNRVYKIGSYNNNKYIGTSAYQTDENPLEDWLITPAINLDETEYEILTFKTQAHHDNGITLSVYVSTDFTGIADDITSATWNLVDANIGEVTGSGNYGSWTDSGSIDLGSLGGSVYVAFKYVGNSSSITTGMNIDDVKIIGINNN